MRRAIVMAALVLALTGCSQTGRTDHAVARAQSQVEKQRTTLERVVREKVEPRLPGALRDPGGYDPAALETYLVASQRARFADVGTVGAARCPDGLDLVEGLHVTCTLTVAGSRVPYALTLSKVSSEQPVVTVKLGAVVIPAAGLAALIVPTLPAGSAGASVSCGRGDLLVAAVGATAPCRLVLGAQATTFSVTVKDAEGRVSIAS